MLRAVVLTVAAVVVVALVVVATSALVLVRRPLPSYSGEVALEGLHGEVEVLRDAQGVPQVYASDARDLFRAQGYVQAQDRFFEMDYRRLVSAGRLAELVGDVPEAIASDAAARTLGWADVAEKELSLLSPQTRAYLEAYADGVNDYLQGRESSRVALEYSVLGLTRDLAAIEPWTPLDSLTWLKAAAWDLQGGDTSELQRASVYGVVNDVRRVDELYPAYPEDLNPTILDAGTPGTVSPRVPVPDAAAFDSPFLILGGNAGLAAIDSAITTLDLVPRLIGEASTDGGSSWVVAGDLTASGAPLVAVDPHLSPTAPGPWYQVGLHCREVSAACPFDVSGIGLTGIPGVWSGHNGALAFATTPMPADTTDYMLERILDGTTYLVDGQRLAIERRTETIEVNGGDDVRLEVRSTVHGPLVSDALPGPGGDEQSSADPRGYGVALAWAGLTPGRTLDGLLALGTARTAEDVAAASALVGTPALDVVWGATDGRYGYQAAGSVPARLDVVGAPLPSDGTWPRAGWVSAYDWQGFLPVAEMPRTTRTGPGYLVAANQAVQPSSTPSALDGSWDAGYRARRITALLDEEVARGEGITPATTATLQQDDLNPYAEMLVPYLLRTDVQDAFVEEAVDLLRSWDFHQDSDSAAAAYFASVWTNVLRLAFWDAMPPDVRPDGGSRWLEVVRNILDDPDNLWWDDRSTLNVVETRDEVLLDAMTAARIQLTSSIGKDATRWRWATLHTAAPEHPLFGGPEDGAALRRLVDPRPVAVSGGSSIVLATAWDARDWDGEYPSFSTDTLPTARLAMDLGDLDASTWVTLTGISGHPGSPHYTDQMSTWLDGGSFPWPSGPAAVADSAVDTLRLVPVEGADEG